jgi:flagellar biogenesis protein FliO
MTGVALHFVVGVAIVGGLLWGASRLARSYGAGATNAGRDGTLRVVARRQVAKGASIVRVSVEDKDLLLGASQKGVELLCELPKTRAVPEATPAASSFATTGWQPRPTLAEALSRSLNLRRRRY